MGKRISNDWAKDHIVALGRGESVQFRPVGGSMKGIIENGDLVEVKPIDTNPVIGNVVLVQVGNFTYLHLIKEIRNRQYLIGNNRGGINGWVDRDAIYGILSSVNGVAPL